MKEFRRDTLGVHVKAKHTEDIKAILLHDYATNNVSTLRSLQKGLQSPVPVYSKMYEGGCYIFGIKPMYFSDECSYGAYIKIEENMAEHYKYIDSVLETINLKEFYAINKELCFNSKELSDMKRELRNIQDEYAEYKSSTDGTIEYLKEVVKEFQETPTETIEDMRKSIQSLTTHNQEYRDEIKRLVGQVKMLKQEEDYSLITRVKETSMQIEQQLMDMMNERNVLRDKLKEEKATYTLRVKNAINEAFEKEKEKKKAEKEKAKKEKAKAKKKAKEKHKKFKALNNIRDSDSSSDSDSDSNSDSE